MLKKISAFHKANDFPLQNLINYFKFSSKAELIFDILGPILLSILIVYFLTPLNGTFKDVFSSIEKINNQALTAISILAGFNVASISVLASSQSKVMEYLRNKTSKKHENVTLFNMLMTFFSWAIVIQLIIILIGIVILVGIAFYQSPQPPQKSQLFPIWGWSIIGVWISLIIHSIFISIRNLKNLYHYMTSNINEK